MLVQFMKYSGILSLSLLLMWGCSSTETKELSEREIYENAKKSLSLQNFQKATMALENLEAKFPFGKYAEQAQLDLIYARYSNLDLDGAILAADRFIRLHPQSPNVDYAYYMRGLANYYIDSSLAARYFPDVDISSRDLGSMRQAFSDFNEVLRRFPDSDYGADSRQRMIAIRDRLAAYELHAARYYIKRGAYIAAANRAAYVIEHFPNTPSAENALSMMNELYLELGKPDLAQQALSLLRENFPDSERFDEDGKYLAQFTFKQNRSFLSAITFGLLD